MTYRTSPAVDDGLIEAGEYAPVVCPNRDQSQAEYAPHDTASLVDGGMPNQVSLRNEALEGGTLTALINAAAWLHEMAGYAVEHLDPEWANRGGPGNRNSSDLRDAISQVGDALARVKGGTP